MAGYRTWQKLGRQVRQGERGIQILAPVVHRTKTTERVDEEGDDTEILSGFRPTYVFDVSQTEGKALPVPNRVRGDPGEYLNRLEAWVVRHRIKLEYAPWIGPAEGMSTGGRILLRSRLDAGQAFSVLVHELAHEMLHQDEELPKTVDETEAEAVAFVVCEAVGLESNTASSDYIQLYRGDKEMLLNSIKRIHRTAGEIIKGIEVGERQSMETEQPPRSLDTQDAGALPPHFFPLAARGTDRPAFAARLAGIGGWTNIGIGVTDGGTSVAGALAMRRHGGASAVESLWVGTTSRPEQFKMGQLMGKQSGI